MKKHAVVSMAACAVLLTHFLSTPIAAQQSRGQRTSGKAWRAPRTPWGDPDLQGVWPGTDFVGVPLQRPDGLGTRNELTDEEFKARVAAAERQRDDDNADFDIANVPAEVIARGAVGGPVSPPPHWLERGI